MNIASLELCKELYELSGWDAVFPELHHWLDGEVWHKNLYQSDADDESTFCPAYDLGYLLRKLPPVIHEDKKFLALEIDAQGDGTWHFAYTEPYDKEFLGWHITKAETPEDAACKLAIELLKQGMLNKESHE